MASAPTDAANATGKALHKWDPFQLLDGGFMKILCPRCIIGPRTHE